MQRRGFLAACGAFLAGLVGVKPRRPQERYEVSYTFVVDQVRLPVTGGAASPDYVYVQVPRIMVRLLDIKTRKIIKESCCDDPAPVPCRLTPVPGDLAWLPQERTNAAPLALPGPAAPPDARGA